MSDLMGKIIGGRYRVEAFLGKGGMAEVYKVWDQIRSVPLAMKIMHADMAEDKVFLRRFKREAQTLQKLQHPNIVRFYGLEQADDLFFLLMEYVEGTTLRKEIFKSDQPFYMERILQVMQPVTAALHYAHQSGFVHCDVKPANIMIHKNGNILAADFGIARVSESETVSLAGAGTPAYMSPEQIMGEAPTPQMDIYALGVILFEMVTGGERPFTGEQARITGTTPEKIRWEQRNLAPPSPRLYNPSLSSDVENIIVKCLQKNASKRFKTALDLYIALETAGKNAQKITPENKFEKNPNAEATLIETAHEEPKGEIPSKEGLSSLFDFLSNRIKLNFKTAAAIGITAAFLLAFFSMLPAAAPTIEEGGGIYFSSNRAGAWQVYYMDSEGIVTQVTQGPSDNFEAVKSEKAGGIYFTSNRAGKAEVFFLTETGKIIQVTRTEGNGESWNPMPYEGGLYFASNRSGKAEIYYIGKTGQAVQVTHTEGSFNSSQPTPTDDGLYFLSDRAGGTPEIFLMNSKTGEVSQITTSANASEGGVAASPYQKGVFYVSKDMDGNFEIFYADKAGNDLQVTHTEENVANLNPFAVNDSLYFVSNRTGFFEVYHLNLKNGNVTQITHSPENAISATGPLYH